MSEAVTKPDPGLFADFTGQMLPALLTELDGITDAEARAAGQDVYARACALAQFSASDQRRIAMPFFEETYFYDPAGAEDMLRAAVALAVRNSALESLHSRSLLGDAELRLITSYAARPLSHLIAAARLAPLPDVPERAEQLRAGWAALAVQTPRAWAAFGALADLSSMGGGRIGVRRHDGRVPEPVPAEAGRVTEHGAVVLDGMDPRLDRHTVELMTQWAQMPGQAVFVRSLTRFSRELGKLAVMIEYLLAHGVEVLSTNYLLRPGDVWARRTIVAPADSLTPTTDLAGLSGAHRRLYTSVLRAMSAGAAD